MTNLIIDKRKEETLTPIISFDAKTGYCEMIGETCMEDPPKFYLPVYDWLDNYFKTTAPIELNVRLTSINSPSSKCILNILNMLFEYKEKGRKVKVLWHYPKDLEEEICEEIEDYSVESQMEIEGISY